MKDKLKSLQKFYVVALVLSIVYMLLSFFDVVPTDYVENEPQLLYWVNIYSIISGLGGMYVCLRWFNFHSIANAVKNVEKEQGFHSYCRWTKLRLWILTVILLSNVVLYQASSYTETPKYCMLIAYVTCVFCWPSMSAFEHIREDNRKNDDAIGKW